MTPKTFYISDIYESFLAVMLFLFLPVIVIPVVWPKNHFLFVRNWLRFWILPSGWNFIKSHRKWIILGWILQDQCFVLVFFTFVFIITIIIGEGGGGSLCFRVFVSYVLCEILNRFRCLKQGRKFISLKYFWHWQKSLFPKHCLEKMLCALKFIRFNKWIK